MNDFTYVYSIEIAATPEKVWEALTQDAFWKQYWGGEWGIESVWLAGTKVQFYSGDGAFYSEGEVLESDPPRTLAYTWPNLPEEQGTAPPEVLRWVIEPLGPGAVRLTITHSNLTREYHDGVSNGWPVTLSRLRSLLETGSTMARAS